MLGLTPSFRFRFVQQDQVLVILLMIMMIKMIVTRSRNTRDPIPVSSSPPKGLVTMEEMFQMVTTNNANIRPSVLLDV